jgi:hypothetical protein
MNKNTKAFMICASISFLIIVTMFDVAKNNTFAAEASKAKCDALHDEIENDFKKANFCNTDSDCTFIQLGGWYIDFGCYKFVNRTTNEDELLAKVEKYKDVMKCSGKINDCMSPGKPVCVNKKCTGKKD